MDLKGQAKRIAFHFLCQQKQPYLVQVADLWCRAAFGFVVDVVIPCQGNWYRMAANLKTELPWRVRLRHCLF